MITEITMVFFTPDELRPPEAQDVLLYETGIQDPVIGRREGDTYLTTNRRLKGIDYWTYLPTAREIMQEHRFRLVQ